MEPAGEMDGMTDADLDAELERELAALGEISEAEIAAAHAEMDAAAAAEQNPYLYPSDAAPRGGVMSALSLGEAAEAAAAEAAAAEARREEAEGELKGEVNRRITVARVQNAKERARRMEVQFARLQQLAGLGRIDEVVERCIAQGQARAPMAPRDQPAFHSRIRSNRAGTRADARDPRRRDAQTASARRREGADGGGV